MKVAVTGAGGRIGSRLVRKLLERGDQVRAVEFELSPALEGLELETVAGDVRNRSSLERAFHGIDVVFHLAGIVTIGADRGGLVHEINARGAENAARAALATGVRRFVHVCSTEAFDTRGCSDSVDETCSRVPSGSKFHGAYELSKAEGERRVRAVASEGLDAVIVHPTAVIGPDDPGPSTLGHLLIDLYHRRQLALCTGGFNFVDVRDVALGLIAAAERGRCGESYILSGEPCSIVEFGQLCSAVTGVPAPRLVAPLPLVKQFLPFVTLYDRLRGAESFLTSHSLRILSGPQRFRHDKAAHELGYRRRPLIRSVYDAHRSLADDGHFSGAALRTTAIAGLVTDS